MKIKYSICKYKLKHRHAESVMDPPDLNSRVTMTRRQKTNKNHCYGRGGAPIEPNKLVVDDHAKCGRSSEGKSLC